jgi:hypothetical protein
MTFFTQGTSLQQQSWNPSLRRLAVRFRAVVSEAVDRNGMKTSLGNLSAKNLNDTGLIENDVASIKHLSLSSDAARELSKTRRSRSTNW